VRLERLAGGHILAVAAAVALLLVMSLTWYGSHEADLARQLAKSANIGGGEAGETGRTVQHDANRIIARDEKTPWQERARIDRILVVLLLASIGLALLAAVVRAAGRRPPPPWTPTALAGLTAAGTGVLLAYRIVSRPGNHAATTVKPAALIALGLVVLIGIGCALAFAGEAEWAERDDAPNEREEPTAPQST
jgi:drug/metabolite transporter (DMT)-like permease